MRCYKVVVILMFYLFTNFSHAKLPSPFNIIEDPFRDTEAFNIFHITLTILISQLTPIDQPVTPPPINTAVGIFHLDMAERIPVKLRGISIASIDLIVHSVDFRKIQDTNQRNQHINYNIIITFVDGKQELFKIQDGENKQKWPKFACDFFPVYGGYLTHINSHRNVHKPLLPLQEYAQAIVDNFTPETLAKLSKIDLQNPAELARFIDCNSHIKNQFPLHTMSELNYDATAKLFYRWHRSVMARLLYRNLQDSKYLHAVKSSGSLLVSLGSGSGHDLRTTLKFFQQAGLSPHTLGVDNHPSLVKLGKKNHPHLHIIQGDALNAANLIREQKRKLNLPLSAPTLIMTEGLLTRQVLTGPYQALQVLQQLIQEGVADLVVVGGLAPLLVNENIASSAGWLAQTVMIHRESDDSFHPALALARPDQDEQMQSIQKRSINRSRYKKFTTLDLSAFGLPLLAIRHFLQQPEAKEFTLIDLSWSYLTNYDLDELIILLAGFPKLRNVMVSAFEPWIDTFTDKIKMFNQFQLLKRLDNLYINELPSFETWMARLLGQYNGMPNEILFKSTSQQSPLTSSDWTNDIAVSHLNLEAQQIYSNSLLSLLNQTHLALQSTLADGMCFYHAVANQLDIDTSFLRATLLNHLELQQETISNDIPALAGEQLTQLLEEIRNGAWGDIKIALLIAKFYKKRVIVIYPGNSEGGIGIQVFNPDGTGSDTLPADLSLEDVVLVHSGQGHWLGATSNQELNHLWNHNTQILSVGFKRNIDTAYQTYINSVIKLFVLLKIRILSQPQQNF